MDGSKQQPMTTVGLDLGDRYSYLCLIDSESGEVIEEGRLRTSPEPSDDASPPSGLLCASPSRPVPTRRGRAGC